MRIYWGTLLKKCDKDKDNFPFGITFYDAPQGGGKSLSMTFDALELKRKYKDLHLISNLIIKDWENAQYFNNPAELVQILNNSENYKHTLVIIDEALTYFAENGGIDPGLMSEITQNRKQRRLMFIATQKFKRTNNRLRDFSLKTVKCSHLGNFQINTVRDDQTVKWDKQEMDFVGKRLYTYIFKRNNDLYKRYDTFAKTNINTTSRTDRLFTPARAPAQAQDREKVVIKKKGWI